MFHCIVIGTTLRLGGRLFQQYIVDAFSVMEQSRLNWIKNNQKKLRNEVYHNLVDLLTGNDTIEPSKVGQSYILPSSFVGSARYMQQNFMDSLTICRNIGYPSIFLTITCNTLWPEILEMLGFLPTSNPEDYPDVIARVFKLKLDQVYADIKTQSYFGTCIAGTFYTYFNYT